MFLTIPAVPVWLLRGKHVPPERRIPAWGRKPTPAVWHAQELNTVPMPEQPHVW